MKKKWMKIAATLAVAALIFVGVKKTLSYLTDEDQVVNAFTVGDLQLELTEPEWDPEEGDGENVYPGYSVYKNPTIKNVTSDKNGEEPCYARMRIILKDKKGEMITDSKRLALIKTMIRFDSTYTGNHGSKGEGKDIVQGKIPGYSMPDIEKLPMINPLFVIDEERSKEGEIVCDYMGEDQTGILAIGEEATLFTTLAVPTEWTHTEINLLGDFQIIVEAEAIQAMGFADQKTAFEALDAQLQLNEQSSEEQSEGTERNR